MGLGKTTIFSVVRTYLGRKERAQQFRLRKCSRQLVVQFEVVDTWHQSSIGRSWQFFADFREHFRDGDFVVWGGELFLTECGYARLAAKCFHDPLSWEIQEGLLSHDVVPATELSAPTAENAAADPEEDAQADAWPHVPDVLPDDIE